MPYRVIYSPSFKDDVREHIRYLIDEKVAISTLNNWFNLLYDKIDDLAQYPKQYPVDPVQTEETKVETRKLNIGKYLVFYQIDDQHEQVNVMAFIHGSLRKDANN